MKLSKELKEKLIGSDREGLGFKVRDRVRVGARFRSPI